MLSANHCGQKPQQTLCGELVSRKAGLWTKPRVIQITFVFVTLFDWCSSNRVNKYISVSPLTSTLP